MKETPGWESNVSIGNFNKQKKKTAEGKGLMIKISGEKKDWRILRAWRSEEDRALVWFI